MINDFAKIMESAVEIAKQAGQKILPYFYSKEQLDARKKVDNTPITAADLAANEALILGLKQLTPKIPILSEESDIPDFTIRKEWNQYWLLDPLDGTQGFLRGSDEFSVNIALIENQRPVLGVIYAPVQDWCYFAYQGGSSFRQLGNGAIENIHVDQLSWPNIRLLIGQYHSSKRLTLMVERFQHLEVIRLNSSLKFCRIAEGGADIYPRYGPTGEWDTAAGECILQVAGGLMVDLNGEPLHYNAKDSLINPPFVAVGDPSQIDNILHLLPSPEQK